GVPRAGGRQRRRGAPGGGGRAGGHRARPRPARPAGARSVPRAPRAPGDPQCGDRRAHGPRGRSRAARLPRGRVHALLRQADRAARTAPSAFRVCAVSGPGTLADSSALRVKAPEPPRPPGRLRRLRRALYRLYYGLKYLPFAAERRARREDTRRGFVVIQIDALAHEDLERALQRGYMPQLKRLIERDGWMLRRFPAGLPSATPAAQAAIFHGTKDRIPAFRFYEKAQRRVIIGSQRPSMQFIRDRLPERGILDGGSSYVNLFDGGASRAVFTLAAREPQPLFQNLGGTRLLLLLLLHPIRVLRMLVASIWEYLREERDRLVSQFRGRYTYYWWYLPFLHIGSNVILRELQTLAVMLDIYTGVPAIYTTYNAYDEFAHHFGPSSRTALKSLRALDRRIGE